MRLNRRGKKALAGILLFGILMAGIGSALSGWNFLSRGTVKAFTADSKRAEACISRNGQAILYTSIAAAVTDARANEAIYVIPRVNPNNPDSNPIVIDEDITIDNGKKLIIPYSLSIVGGTITAEYQNSYDDEAKKYTREDVDKNSPWFSDESLEQVKINKRASVVLKRGCSISVASGSELIVGGQLGAVTENRHPMGQTAGLYAELSMEGDTALTVNGDLIVNGYIKPWNEDDADNGLTRVQIGSSSASGAEVTLPFVTYDFIGGGDALSGSVGTSSVSSWNGALFGGAVFPIETFDMPNISVPLRVYAGSRVKGQYDIYFSGAHTLGTLDIIGASGSAGLLQLNSGHITFDYEPAAYYWVNDSVNESQNGEKLIKRGLTIGDNRYLSLPNSHYPDEDSSSFFWANEKRAAITSIELDGNANMQDITVMMDLDITFASRNFSFTVGISTAGGDASEFFPDALKAILGVGVDFTYNRLSIPFSYKWDVLVKNSSSFSISSCYANFLPGSKLQIEQGGSLQVTNGGHLAGYQNIDSSTKLTDVYPTKYHDGTAMSDAVIINNGTISVDSSSAFAGYVKTAASDSKISFQEGAGRQVSVNELNWRSSNWAFVPKTQKTTIDLSFGEVFGLKKKFDISSFPQSSFTSSSIGGDGDWAYTVENLQLIEVSFVSDGSFEIDDVLPRLTVSAGFPKDGYPGTFQVIPGSSITIANDVSGTTVGYVKGPMNDYFARNSTGEITVTPSNSGSYTLFKYSEISGGEFTVNANLTGFSRLSAATLSFSVKTDSDQEASTVNQDKGFLSNKIQYKETFSPSNGLHIGSIISFMNLSVTDRSPTVNAASGSGAVLISNYQNNYDFLVVSGTNLAFTISASS